MEKRNSPNNTGIRTPARPATSESLYGLRYSGHLAKIKEEAKLGDLGVDARVTLKQTLQK